MCYSIKIQTFSPTKHTLEQSAPGTSSSPAASLLLQFFFFFLVVLALHNEQSTSNRPFWFNACGAEKSQNMERDRTWATPESISFPDAFFRFFFFFFFFSSNMHIYIFCFSVLSQNPLFFGCLALYCATVPAINFNFAVCSLLHHCYRWELFFHLVARNEHEDEVDLGCV